VEHVKDKLADTASSLKEKLGTTTDTALQRRSGLPSEWYSQMMDFQQSIEQQMQEMVGAVHNGNLERLSYVQQNVERVNGSWISYLNDNGKEYVDVQLGDGVDAKSIDPLVAVNSARQSHGMPARQNLSDVKIQIHHREKPHYYVRTTRILPNGSWTRYENDDGVEVVTEGHLTKKAVTESSLEKNKPDKHPLLNMFRRTFGLAEL